MAVLTIWLVSVVCGILLGQSKDQIVSGIVWPVILGPLGLLIVACLPNRRAIAKEEESRRLLEQQLHYQRKQMEQAASQNRPIPPPPNAAKMIRVAREGVDLGELNLGVVKTMLSNGQLSLQDFFFDPTANDWLPLECHSGLAAML